MSQETQKVVVYRSQSEKNIDDAIWSKGWITPTVFGDVCLLLLAALAVLWVLKRKR